MGSSNIKSSLYVMGISNENTYNDIYKVFYNILKDSVNPTNRRFWYSSFPDEDIVSSSDYPLGVISSPSFNFNNFTQTKDVITTTIDFEVFTTKKEDTDTLGSQVLYQIRNNKHYLAKIGIKDLKLDSDDNDHFMRGEIKVHTKTLTFSLTIRLNKVSLSW